LTDRRFMTAEDTPCPFRMARFGYRRIGEFRAPKNGELYIVPTEGPDLQEHEPLVAGACQDWHEHEQRHIVEALTTEEQEIAQHPLGALFLLLGSAE
jgi:hypothetical protein